LAKSGNNEQQIVLFQKNLIFRSIWHKIQYRVNSIRVFSYKLISTNSRNVQNITAFFSIVNESRSINHANTIS